MANLVDIIQVIINGINREIDVLSVVAQKIYVCDTSYITIHKIIEDSGGNKYKVIDFLEDEWIEVEPYNGAPAFADTVIFAPPITFLHGTPMSVNAEYLAIHSKQVKKTPFIWLLESYEEDDPGAESSIEMIYRFRLFFMEGMLDSDSNDKHNDQAIKPMKRLTELFEGVILDTPEFKRPTDTLRRPRSRFGVEVTNKGNDKRILDDGLSGYEMSLTLEVYDTSVCDC